MNIHANDLPSIDKAKLMSWEKGATYSFIFCANEAGYEPEQIAALLNDYEVDDDTCIIDAYQWLYMDCCLQKELGV